MAPANKNKTKEDAAAQDDPTLPAVVQKALRRDRKWTLAELHDCLLWLKVVLAVLTGIACGVYIDGAVGLVTGGAVVTGVTTLFIQAYLNIDEDAYGGLSSLLLESGYVAFAAFLVAWTVTHSMLYGEELSEAWNQARINLKIPPPDTPPPVVQEL